MLNYRVPLRKLAGCALCCAAAAAALAGPPPAASPGGLLGRASGSLLATPSHSPASHLDFQRLDLRPPETLSGGRASAPVASAPLASAPGDSAAAFPSAKRAPLGAVTGAEEDQAAPSGAGLVALRMESKIHEWERRVPREGLPVARLWETKTALLHVGLSPRGKPGLWLIQKVP
jgi:hypothetical protein